MDGGLDVVAAQKLLTHRPNEPISSLSFPHWEQTTSS